MSRNDAEDFLQRLYARVPAHYRVYDAEHGLPLKALLRVVAEQAANLRQDLDALWDNFFIETCEDWVVPYLGALLGTNLLARPVGQSNRLDVRNTVLWQRRKGTPRMLEELTQAISEWPADLAEFFEMLGWSQNLNHLRLDRTLTADLRDPWRLSRFGTAADPFTHAADFKPARPLDAPRRVRHGPATGTPAWGTPGRFGIKNVGLFVRRLQTFPVRGATPAAAPPGVPPPANAACFTFDPLFRPAPLFVKRSGEPLTRAAFDRSPWSTWGSDVAVRQFGILMASEVGPRPVTSASREPFRFGGAGAGLRLDVNRGIRLIEPAIPATGGQHFIITAEWHEQGGTVSRLGAFSTFYASLSAHRAHAFHRDGTAGGAGRLVIALETGCPDPAWPGPPVLPESPAARFPGAVFAIRAERQGPLQRFDGAYVYLPAAYVRPGRPVMLYVAADGATYTAASLEPRSLARPSEGEVYPSRALTSSFTPATSFVSLNRSLEGLVLPDRARFAGAGILVQAELYMVQAELYTGVFQPLGAVATIDQASSDYPDLEITGAWPAFTAAPSRWAVAGDLPSAGLPTIWLKPLSGNAVPPLELVARNRRGQSLLIYLPGIENAPAEGRRFFVADDGSTYVVPADDVARDVVRSRGSYTGLDLARPAAGQVLPIAGIWPLQHRRAVAADLCACERRELLRFGELGIDPESGRFAFAPEDPATGQGGLSVDYVEAFGDRVGALNFDRKLERAIQARFVSSLRDGPGLVYPSVRDAVTAAHDGDVIEIIDSATYAESEIAIPASCQNLTIRAGDGQRPCLAFYDSGGVPAATSFRVPAPMTRLELNGVLISGAPIRIESRVEQLRLIACSLDPPTASPASVIASDAGRNSRASYLLCRSITGSLQLAAGVGQLTVADSIIDQRGGVAIAGAGSAGEASAANVQLERVTVLGRILCDRLSASECLLDDRAEVQDRQSGCIRFTRFERGSLLPRRYQCVPSDQQFRACASRRRCLAPVFDSLRFGRPNYCQLAAGCPPEILAASESQAEVGAFAGTLNAIRLGNLQIKLREFMPAGLSAVIIAET